MLVLVDLTRKCDTKWFCVELRGNQGEKKIPRVCCGPCGVSLWGRARAWVELFVYHQRITKIWVAWLLVMSSSVGRKNKHGMYIYVLELSSLGDMQRKRKKNINSHWACVNIRPK